MPKFLAVHSFPPTTIEDGTQMAKQVKAINTNINAYWVGSWLQLNEEGKIQLNEEGKIVKIFCEWNAVSAEAVRKEISKVPNLPVDGVYPMVKIDAEDYR